MVMRFIIKAKEQRDMKMSNKTFDTIRFIAEIVGYVITCAVSISGILGWRYDSEANAIASAMLGCIGAIVIASRRYFNGEEVEVEKDDATVVDN